MLASSRGPCYFRVVARPTGETREMSVPWWEQCSTLHCDKSFNGWELTAGERQNESFDGKLGYI